MNNIKRLEPSDIVLGRSYYFVSYVDISEIVFIDIGQIEARLHDIETNSYFTIRLRYLGMAPYPDGSYFIRQLVVATHQEAEEILNMDEYVYEEY